MRGSPNQSKGEIFRELSNAHRLRYLHELRRGPLAAGQLAKLSNLSVQEAMRHLGRLRVLQLVDRVGDRAYVLTGLGELIVNCVPYYDALLGDPGFFLDHDLGFVPAHLSQLPLVAAPRDTGPESGHIQAFEDVAAGGRELLLRAGNQYFWNAIRPHAAAPPRELACVHLPETVRHPRFLEMPDGAIRAGLRAEGLRIRVSLLPEMPLMLAVTEHEVAVFLRRRAGGLDLGTMVRSPDPGLRTWATAMFRHLEGHATVAFDTTRGHALTEWRTRLLAAAEAMEPGKA